jgi:hypothetical protein
MVNKIFSIFNKIHDIKILGIRPFKWVPAIPYIGCVSLGGGLSEDNTAYYPSCECKEGLNASDCPSDMEGNCKKRSSNGALMDLVQQRLAEDYKIIKLDLYQDWINGCLYMPLWFWRKRKKKTFLFFTLSRAKNEYCSCDKLYSRLKTYVTCNVEYNSNSLGVQDSAVSEKENDWHRSKGRAQQVRYKNGIIKEVENKDGLKVYYYTALQARSDNREPNLAMSKRTSEFTAVRLYATDIILLGNLNENNLYGIPQFFKVLPSSTANVPPIATIQEQVEDDENVEEYSKNEVSGGEDSGTTVTTGMDWGRNGGDNSPQYKDGLFMDLACTYAHTKAKSCFNVERLSELGVNLDMSYNMSYAHNANGIQNGMIDSDGFITKIELDDMENRAMFATMNHIGFVPQPYQDSISGYTTQVEDKNTGYLVPKFRYIYPVDFDGRMQILMNRYRNGFTQAMFDEADEAYLTFRLGADNQKNNEITEYNRVRHFYYAEGNSKYEMPLYNNSYYFYFGVKKGSTAIDKFNKLFYSDCYQNDKKPFSYEINTKGRSYCTDWYKCKETKKWIPDDTEDGGHWGDSDVTNNRGYAYIRFTSDDIRTPFSYVLYDSNGVEVIRETDMTDTDFAIGATINTEGEIILNENGRVQYHDENNTPVNNKYGTVSGLTNQVYVLDVFDSDGKRQSERIKLEMDNITFDYVGQRLGTKFYNTDVTRIDYICNDENEFYGVIEITKFYVDTYEYKITAATVITESDEKYVVEVSGELANKDAPICDTVKVDGADQSIKVNFELYALNSNEYSVRDCMCDKGNHIQHNTGITITGGDIVTKVKNDYFFTKKIEGKEIHFMFYVYQPNSFIGKITQICEGKQLEDNTTSEIIKIQNGKNFNTFLNTMPTRFILGTTSDGRNAETAVTSNFYAQKVSATVNRYGNAPLAASVNGWFGTHQEETYQFNLSTNTTVPRNRDIWADFITIGSDIVNVDTRKNILRYKFDKMFRVSDTAYLTTSNNSTFRYTAEGGVEPILYRSVVPFYANYNMMFTTYLYGDNNYVSSAEEFPQVVGSNYYEEGREGPKPLGGNDDNTPRFNTNYKNHGGYIGNYFAAFTKNGRYTTTTSGNCRTSIMALPNYAAVNLESNWKRLGRDLQKNLTSLPKTYESGDNDGECNGKHTQPYLRSLYVDRRLDYDLVIWGPAMGNNMRLHSATESERTWRGARISGWTYGGIEMSFDEEYNIISATSVPYYTVPDIDEYTRYTTSDAAFAATEAQLKVLHPKEEDESDAEWTVRLKKCVVENDDNKKPNNRLEYSYYVDDNENNNAYTVYNKPENGNIVWVNREDTTAKYLYDSTIDSDPTKQYIKTLYESSINEMDVRQLYWSKFNFNRLSTHISDPAKQGIGEAAFETHDNYIFLHNEGDGFNDDFNRESITSNPKNYPTKRLIDIGNIRSQEDYMFTMESCSYGINPEVTEDGEVKCYVEGGENVEINLQFSNPVEFIPPNADNTEYGNAIMRMGSGRESGYRKFNSNLIDLSFRLTKVTSNDFDVYTERPFIIKVLDMNTFGEEASHDHPTDAITYIKSVGKEHMYNANTDDIWTVLRDGNLIIHEFRYLGISSWMTDWFGWENDMFPSNSSVKFDDTFVPFFEKDDDYLTSDDNDFYNIEFKKRIHVNNVYAFTILVLRTYKGNDTDYLTRRIKTIETSSIYDTRRILVEIVQWVKVKDENGILKDVEATYITKSSGVINVEGQTTPEQNGDGGGDGGDEPQPQPQTVNSSGETQTHIQVVTFQIYSINNGTPQNMTNQVFADFNSMGFTVKFKNMNNQAFYLTPEVSLDATSTEDIAKINLKVTFTQEMGVLADKEWNNDKVGARVNIFAKTRDNFTYKLSLSDTGNEFWLENVYKKQAKYNSETKTSSGIDEGEKVITNVHISDVGI